MCEQFVPSEHLLKTHDDGFVLELITNQSFRLVSSLEDQISIIYKQAIYNSESVLHCSENDPISGFQSPAVIFLNEDSSGLEWWVLNHPCNRSHDPNSGCSLPTGIEISPNRITTVFDNW